MWHVLLCLTRSLLRLNPLLHVGHRNSFCVFPSLDTCRLGPLLLSCCIILLSKPLLERYSCYVISSRFYITVSDRYLILFRVPFILLRSLGAE